MTVDESLGELVDSLPEDCPVCEYDFTFERETDIDELYHRRRIETIRHHMVREHRILWYVSKAIAVILMKLKTAKSWVTGR